MASDNDLFSASQSSLLSQPDIEYLWYVVFQWNVNLMRPFQIYAVQELTGNVPDEWATKTLSDKRRKKKMQLPALSTDDYSIFAKIQKGKSGIFFKCYVKFHIMSSAIRNANDKARGTATEPEQGLPKQSQL